MLSNRRHSVYHPGHKTPTLQVCSSPNLHPQLYQPTNTKTLQTQLTWEPQSWICLSIYLSIYVSIYLLNLDFQSLKNIYFKTAQSDWTSGKTLYRINFIFMAGTFSTHTLPDTSFIQHGDRFPLWGSVYQIQSTGLLTYHGHVSGCYCSCMSTPLAASLRFMCCMMKTILLALNPFMYLYYGMFKYDYVKIFAH